MQPGVTRRQILLAAASTAMLSMLPQSSAGSARASLLSGDFCYDTSAGPRLMATKEMIDRAVTLVVSGDHSGNELYAEMLGRYATLAADVRRRYALNPPEFSFAQRSMLTDLVIGYGLAKRVRAGGGMTPDDAMLGQMRDSAIAAALDLVAALRKAGNNTWQYHVGQGSNMMPLAIAYDWLYDDLSSEQRRSIAAAIVEYSIKPTIDAVCAPEGRPERIWWVTGFNNWSTICIGGAILGALALRRAGYDEPFESFVEDGSRQTRSLEEHFDFMLPRGLERFHRGLEFIENTAGGSDEGPGYHHDMIYPLWAVIVSLQAALKNPTAPPAVVTEIVARARRAACDHLNTAIHMASPIPGKDFEYGDGTWPITDQPINFLIADDARRAGAPLWRASAWQTNRRVMQREENRGVILLYRSLFDWNAPITADRGMAGFDPTTIPGAVLMHRKVVDYGKGEVGSNEFLTLFRQNFTDPNGSAVLFKGGDKRKDHHERLDTGTFVYDSQGVRWSIITGRPDGYPLYFKDGVKQWTETTSYQTFPKRACAQNTLVINSARNDYTLRKVKRDWLWQVNPDQSMEDGTSYAVSPVEQFDADPRKPTWSASVNLAGAYERFGVRTKALGAADDPRRTLTFERGSGAVSIRDRVEFTEAENDLWWFMQVAPSTTAVAVQDRRLLLAAPRADGTLVYLEMSIDGCSQPAKFTFGPIAENLPAGQPKDDVLWGYGNASAQKKTQKKVAIHLAEVGSMADLAVSLKPRPDLAGKATEEALKLF